MFPKIIKVEPLDDYRVKLTYRNGERKVFDVKPYIGGSWYGKLNSSEYFSSVHPSADGSSIEWKDGQDIAPHELYENSDSL